MRPWLIWILSLSILCGCTGNQVEEENAAFLLRFEDFEARVNPQILLTHTQARVITTFEAVPEGFLLHIDVANPQNHAVVMPEFTLGPFYFGTQIPRFYRNGSNQFEEQPPLDLLYPVHEKMPVMGLMGPDYFIGAALMYDPIEVGCGLRMAYRKQQSSGHWFFDFTPVNPIQNTQSKLASFEGHRLSLLVCMTNPQTWVKGFRAYKAFLAKQKDQTKEMQALGPVYRLPLGEPRYVHPTKNPRGYYPWSGGTGAHRLDQVGWRGFQDHLGQKLLDYGFIQVQLDWLAGGKTFKGVTLSRWDISNWHPQMQGTAVALNQLSKKGLKLVATWETPWAIPQKEKPGATTVHLKALASFGFTGVHIKPSEDLRRRHPWMFYQHLDKWLNQYQKQAPSLNYSADIDLPDFLLGRCVATKTIDHVDHDLQNFLWPNLNALVVQKAKNPSDENVLEFVDQCKKRGQSPLISGKLISVK